MRVTLSITNSEGPGDDQDLLSLEVYPDMTIDTLRSSIHAETGFEPPSQHLYHNGQLITDAPKRAESCVSSTSASPVSREVSEPLPSSDACTRRPSPAPRARRLVRGLAPCLPRLSRLQANNHLRLPRRLALPFPPAPLHQLQGFPGETLTN
ncbi:hypothetical protein B0T18DRAFT_61258 [Schizothecium vesticola]|uniref:Ubiquitin-like domain-containing protein n=1 Tax=Schizothecium vesticola TaxID=314040 RepID=A0AA40F4C3_9PEZI|nr:hypothetical protein B0T18DRAFT_61258 [Schizothecium vesticola]